MSDSIKQIRESIEARIVALPDGFIKLKNKYELDKNNFSNSDKRFGVIAKDGTNAGGLLRNVTIDRNFEITLCNGFKSTNNGDDAQEIIGDLLESLMEDIILDLSSSNLGLPALVLEVNYSANDEINFDEIENLAFLRFNIIVKFRKQLTNC